MRSTTTTNNDNGVDPNTNNPTPTRNLSLPHAILTVVGTMVGGGMLAMPFALSRIGLVGGVIALALSAVLADFTYQQLIHTSRLVQQHGNAIDGSDTLDGLARILFGHRGEVFLVAVLLFCTESAAMSYVMLSSDLMDTIMETLNHKSPPPHGITILVFLVLAFPISLPRKLEALRNASAMAVMGAVVVALVVLQAAIRNPRPWHELHAWPMSILDVFYALPFFVIAFIAHFSILPAYRELIMPTPHRTLVMTRVSALIGFTIYTTIAVSGYVYAGNQVCDSIFANLPTGPGTTLARIGLVFILYLSFPLLIQPARTCIFVLWAGCTNNKQYIPTTTQHVLVTILLVGGACFAAFVIPSVSVVFSFTGSSINVLVGITFPCLLIWKAIWMFDNVTGSPTSDTPLLLTRHEGDDNDVLLTEDEHSTFQTLYRLLTAQRGRKLGYMVIISLVFGITSTIASSLRVNVECHHDGM